MMIHLTELSLTLKAAIDVAMTFDPLVASDADYCLKTWMAGNPGTACRPWRASIHKEGVRITGWRSDPPQPGKSGTYVGYRAISLTDGQALALDGRFVALRRSSNAFGSGRKTSRDAADGRTDPNAAYEAWLRERLVDLMPYATIDNVTIEAFHRRRVLRKFGPDQKHARVREQLIPVVDAVVLLTVQDPAAVEAWLIGGIGPQKAFGYGAFIPTLDPRAGWPI